jgi:hypothetical protein
MVLSSRCVSGTLHRRLLWHNSLSRLPGNTLFRVFLIDARSQISRSEVFYRDRRGCQIDRLSKRAAEFCHPAPQSKSVSASVSESCQSLHGFLNGGTDSRVKRFFRGGVSAVSPSGSNLQVNITRPPPATLQERLWRLG